MTPADILAIAAKHGAYPDCTPTLRGEEAIVAFAREVLAKNLRQMQDLYATKNPWYVSNDPNRVQWSDA